MVKKAIKKVVKKPTSSKEEFQPTRMSLAVAALAAVSLVLVGVIAVYM